MFQGTFGELKLNFLSSVVEYNVTMSETTSLVYFNKIYFFMVRYLKKLMT